MSERSINESCHNKPNNFNNNKHGNNINENMIKENTLENVKCIYSNVDCILNKIDEIELYLKTNNIDIAAFTETMPKNTNQEMKQIIKNTKPIIPGYACESNPEGRGVCLFIKENIELTRYPDIEQISNPSIFCKVKLTKETELTLGVVYRSPNSDREGNEKINLQIETVCNTFYNKNNNNKLIILGDFNYPDINWTKQTSNRDDEHKSTIFLNTVQDNYLTQMIDRPTHYRPLSKPTLIDLLLTNEPELFKDIKLDPPFGKSHHQIISFELNLSLYQDKGQTVLKHQIDKGDYDKMRNYVQSVNWDNKFMDNTDIDIWWENFEDVITESKDKFIPKKKYKPGKVTNFKRTFIPPPGILEKIRLKRRLYKQYKKNPNSIENYNMYVSARSLVNDERHNAKRTKEHTMAKDIKKNPKAFFKYVSAKSKPKENISNLLKENGSLTTNDKEKCDTLNDFFSSVFTKEDINNLPDFNNKTNVTIPNIDITKEDVTDALNKLNISKSPGPDLIHPRILRELAVELGDPLKRLFDKSVTDGKLPTKWKLAEVRPIFKKGNKSQPGNYRPVSLTSVVCKLLEGFIRDALYKHLVNNELLSVDQYGFCTGRSCMTQLLVTIGYWMESLDNDVPVDAVYLDFSKAFDTVPHKRLLTKLEGYGVTGNILKWIKDFLHEREQYVSINNEQSCRLPVTSGVPQGSVLGPTLFIYYINDLSEISNTSNNIHTKIFADDTKVFTEVKNEEDKTKLQKCLDDMIKWTEDWLLRFNKEKCHVMHLGKNNPNYEYSMSDKNDTLKLSCTKSEKDLGVYVDPLLNFEDHITQCTNKARKMSYLIIKTISYKSKDIMVPLFKALIRPIVEYANTVWSPFKRKDINLIERIQRNFTKFIAGTSEMSYEDRLSYLNLPSLEFRRIRGDLIETYKILHQKYDPETTKTLLKLVSNDNKTRNNSLKITKYRANHDNYKYYYTNRINNLWNNLPYKVVTAKSVNNFKNQIDKTLKDFIFQTNIKLYY